MKVMVLVKATPHSESGLLPDAKLLAEMGQFNQKLAEAGVLVAGEGLLPSSKGARVRFSGTERTVTDGPFTETHELVAGYWIWQVQTLADAIEWVKRCPNPMPTDSVIEIRPVLESASLGEPSKPHPREEEAAARAAEFGLSKPRFESRAETFIAGLNQNYMFVSKVNIPSQWARFVPQIGQIPGRIGQMTFGVSTSDRSDGGFEYLSGVEVVTAEGMPSEFTTRRLPGCRYAVFPHDQHVSTIPETMDKIWKKWLPNSGMRAASSPCFELYSEKFSTQTGTGGIEIWVPIQNP